MKVASQFTISTKFTTVLITLLCLSCQPKPCTTQLAFYHWKTEVSLKDTEQAYLEQLSAQRLYLRLFDVDWEPGAQVAAPKADAQIKALPAVEIVPTIYITNRTIAQLDNEGLSELSERILERVTRKLQDQQLVELQIDCDWTTSTREGYFFLLTQLREQLPEETKLSATLRLHQYRWPEKTGVPPVDRTMLMFYNMGDLEEWEEPNSILNLDKAAAYLQHTNTYPLPIDLALPLFRWGVLFRYGKMIKLINGLTAEDVVAAGGIPLDDKQHRFRIPESTYLQGYYLYADDELRLENIQSEVLVEAAQLLQALPCASERFLSFYHLDSTLIEAFPTTALQQVQQVLDQETNFE
ncbi:MAG: hypothetical protein AAFR36_32350 [Bacteroidota bacterium]